MAEKLSWLIFYELLLFQVKKISRNGIFFEITQKREKLALEPFSVSEDTTGRKIVDVQSSDISSFKTCDKTYSNSETRKEVDMKLATLTKEEKRRAATSRMSDN